MRGCDLRVGAFPGRLAWLAGLLLLAPIITRAEQLPIRTYTAADGLGSSYVIHLMRDSRGFMWFCTRNGLSRFDGYRFFTYNTEHGLPSPTINYMIETHGVYWIATNGGGVCRFNPAASLAATAANSPPVFTTYPVGDTATTNNVNVLYEDRAGRIWAGTDDGLFRLEESKEGAGFRRVELAMLPPAWRGISSLLEDREGRLWIGAHWGLVRRLPDGQLAHYALRPSSAGDVVNGLLADREGRLWVGHREGLLRFTPEPAAQLQVADRGSWVEGIHRSDKTRQSKIQSPKSKIPNGEARWYTAADGLAGNQVSGFLQSSDGRVWINTVGGLTEFDGKQFRSYTPAHGLSDTNVKSLAEDTDGNLWIGSRNGAMKLTLHGFTAYDEADGLGDLRIHSLFADAAGDTLAVSGDWFIHRFDGNRFAPTQPRLPGNVFYNWSSQVAFLDRAGGWWILTNRGLYRFNKVSRLEQLARRRPDAVYTTREGLADNRLLRLYEDGRGDIWIGVYRGLARWERATGRLQTYSESDGLPTATSPTAFCEDRAGNLWVGFNGGGLARYAAGRFTFFTGADGLPAGAVTALYLDRAGRLWLATNENGLTYIVEPAADRPRFVTLTTADGLSTNNVRCITEDLWGRIYIGTARGVDRIDPETRHVRRYTTTDGLANDFVTAAFRDRHGALWFGTLRGLSRLVPAMDMPRSLSVSIGGLRINGKPYAVAETGQTEIAGLELGPQQNQIQIDFFSLSFAPGEVLRYQYRMEGTHQEWSAPSEQRAVDFASLQPGAYRFLVRAVSADGAASDAPASVAFTIAPPVWQRGWFLTLAALLIGLAAYAIYRLRVARLIELERVRMRIATDLHDDIGSSLSQIAILSEVALTQAENGGNRPASQLSRIARISRESVDAISDIVWAINPQRDWLGDLIGRMRRFAAEVFAARNIELRFDAPPPERDMRLGADVRRQVFLIFKEGVNNCVRHSGCAQADITVTTEGGWLVLKLSDNGRGFDPAAAGSGHGLMSMRKRAEGLGGELHIASKVGEGTTVTLRVPRPRHTLRLLAETAKSKRE